MSNQKKLWVFLVIGLLKIGLITGLNAQQLNLVTPPGNYQDALDVVYNLYGSQIQISNATIEEFMQLALSDLPYDSSLPNPDADLVYINTTSFNLEWPSSPSVTQYRTSMIDLGNGAKENLVTNTPSYSANFLGNGPTLIVLQATSEFASRANIIIIDKIVMYHVDTEYNCECDKPRDIKNVVPEKNAYSSNIRAFSLQDTNCERPQFQMQIKLLLGEETLRYKFSWEMDFEERLINLGNIDCSDQLVINYIPSEDYPNSLISEDRNLSLRLGEYALVVEVLNEDAYLVGAELDQCCGSRRSTPRSAAASDPSMNQFSTNDLFAKINILPNPNSGQFELELDSKKEQTVQFQLLSPQGIQLQEWTNIKLYAGQQSFNLNVEDYPTGIYFLQVANQGQKALKRIALIK